MQTSQRKAQLGIGLNPDLFSGLNRFCRGVTVLITSLIIYFIIQTNKKGKYVNVNQKTKNEKRGGIPNLKFYSLNMFMNIFTYIN